MAQPYPTPRKGTSTTSGITGDAITDGALWQLAHILVEIARAPLSEQEQHDCSIVSYASSSHVKETAGNYT